MAYLSLGSNLGDRSSYIESALRLLGNRVGNLIAVSHFYETAAWGNTDMPAFLNIAASVATTLSPLELLNHCQAIEKELGRERHEKWGARTIDIDILLYDGEIIDIPGLTIPHKYMLQRNFVMQPLAAIAPDILHPVARMSISALAGSTKDDLPAIDTGISPVIAQIGH